MPATRKVAKERLSVILQSQRGSELLKNIDVDAMKLDVLEVVRKHVKLAKDRPVSFSVSSQDGMVEVNVEMEMDVETAATRSRKR
eukprot:CAMPEP_0113315148 /NCGR_PEP_ID=MMETSP0010_2-20120614/10932_1 /TAXON_ID=216773 ORGANISM="Corethron hystrix, Strain 308" /NCGR_SAMPLE_ID=MMETSP0010_2 /ASSEMBLY_ACC=CAM_ASM_000155 /LENGTH=84 /DNA_ID=CAMNT_0000171591 /DNA_START=198 /DNA_END=452 /DNA_ORIENTATION=+ /assembly_acc=CAM_ASM_000155